jgi:hypothetical protein
MNTYRVGHVCLSAWFNPAAGQIQMKFGMVVIPLETTYKIMLVSFLQLIIPAWQTNRHVRWD